MKKLSSLFSSLWPAIAALATASLILLVIWIIDSTEHQQFQQQQRIMVLERLSSLRSQIESTISDRISLNRGIIHYVSTLNPDISQNDFATLAAATLSGKTGVHSLFLYRNNQLSHYYPENQATQDFGKLWLEQQQEQGERSLLQRAAQSQTEQIIPLLRLPNGQHVLLNLVPIFYRTSAHSPPHYWGMASLVLLHDALFAEAKFTQQAPELSLALRAQDQNGIMNLNLFGDQSVFYQRPLIQTIQLPHDSWRLAAVPGEGWPEHPPITPWLWVGGVTFAALAGLLVFMLLSEPRRLRESIYHATAALRQAEHERIALLKAYERFVPREFLRLLNKNSVLDVKLGDQIERNMTVLFADIRGFTAISEHMTPQENFDFINSYLKEMLPAIHAHNGFVDKYIGDAIMALFPGPADDALRCAIAMQRQLKAYNQLRQDNGRICVEIGIGINSGMLMLGTVGGPKHMEGTVISDTVNLAARIENLTKAYHLPLLITEHTLKQLLDPTNYHIRITDQVTVKGKSKAVTVYEVFDADPPNMLMLKQHTKPLFGQAFELFQQEQFQEAMRAFEEIHNLHPEDQVAATYIHQCQHILRMTHNERPRILVVDDVQQNRYVLSQILLNQRFHVQEAANASEALYIAETQAPHLILLDIMMPDVDGFEVCRLLKTSPGTQDIPVIFITGLPSVRDKIKGFELGAMDYIVRPYQNEEVVARVKAHLSVYRLRQRLQARHEVSNIHNETLRMRIEQRIQAQGLDKRGYIHDTTQTLNKT